MSHSKVFEDSVVLVIPGREWIALPHNESSPHNYQIVFWSAVLLGEHLLCSLSSQIELNPVDRADLDKYQVPHRHVAASYSQILKHVLRIHMLEPIQRKS